jgi:sugar phosphate isomerase/epimerase
VLSFATMATVALADDGSATVRHPLDRVLRAAAGAGFHGVALDWFTLRSAEGAGVRLAAVAQRARDLGLVVTDLSALGLGPDPGSDDAVSRSMARRCAALGIPLCVLVLRVPPSPAVYDRVARCADTFAASGARLALEFVPYTDVRSLGEAREVCARVGHERCGLLVDTWHLARTSGAPADLTDLGPHEIAAVQVADAAPSPDADIEHESRRGRLLPGRGVVDFPAVAAALTAVGFDGPVGTEVLSADLTGLPPETVAAQCFRAAAAFFPA